MMSENFPNLVQDPCTDFKILSKSQACILSQTESQIQVVKQPGKGLVTYSDPAV